MAPSDNGKVLQTWLAYDGASLCSARICASGDWMLIHSQSNKEFVTFFCSPAVCSRQLPAGEEVPLQGPVCGGRQTGVAV